MNIFSSKTMIALFMVITGSILTSLAPSGATQIVIMSIIGIIAILIVVLEPQPKLRETNIADIQRAKLLEQTRHDAFQTIIDLISDPILLVRDAKVAAANPIALEVLGDHIVDQDIRIAIRHPAAAERLANPNAIHDGEPILLVGVGSPDQRWELRIQLIDAGLKLVQLTDRSSRYATERMRTDFVANASHELRTPLATIKGFLETLQDPAAGKDDDTRARFLRIMYNEADRMQRLIEDLMSLSRIEAGKFKLPLEPVNLEALVKESRDFYINSRGKLPRDINIKLPPTLPMVRGDKAQLTQLIHNLISNAFKYGKKNSPVTIIIEPGLSASMVKIVVMDQGDGISAEHIPRLTERFYRVDKGRSKSIGGTGLGLSIVKHIVERHGGRMEIQSEIGVGTRVSISLPAVKQGLSENLAR